MKFRDPAFALGSSELYEWNRTGMSLNEIFDQWEWMN
jgi:hypothetical protein